MFRKTRLLVPSVLAAALVAIPLSLTASTPREVLDASTAKVAQAKFSEKWIRSVNSATTPTESGTHRYIVQFNEAATPTFLEQGGQLDINSSEARAYIEKLRVRQGDLLARMAAAGNIEVLRTHQLAINGATVRMDSVTASKVRGMPGVRFVERDRALELSTATSVSFIGAPQVWDGAGTGGVDNLGEGVVVGIIDSGINHEHPSFDEQGDDGYLHTNPLGEGNYLGECAEFPGLCNNKLIGAYTFLDNQASDPPDEALIPGDFPSSDTDGHGSHVASTAAGNILYDIALPDADGNPSSIVFDQISGVAPHANVVAYKVCAPSCFTADIVASVDQAIADGVVDVLNHSISSGPGSPWASSQGEAFLNARAAGIFVANSAGNSGPDAGTAEAGGNAPWAAAVAATTHDRSYPEKQLLDMAGGDTAAPADIPGRSVSGGISSGKIVYAGDFPVGAPGDPNFDEPEQCLEPFPEGTFASDQIVLCDRGAIARVAKGQHVRDGGAGGFILGNVDGGATSVNDDTHVIPAIHINASNAAIMRTWLATGADHTGTITAVDSTISDPAAGDNLADFSSRGPYTGFDILAPNIAAPGVDILAAGADLTAEQVDFIRTNYPPNQWDSVAGSYGAIGGTSMSSPHIAGSAALLKQAHPTWSDAAVLSAMMTTGSYDLVKEDGSTPADPHDFGGGRVQLALAVNAPLILDESIANFRNADPALGGDPGTLNVAAMVRESCVQSCSWTRTVTATTDGSWTASGFDSWVTVTPASFTLSEGESQEIEITADASSLLPGAWSFSRAVLTPAGGDLPITQMPVAVVSESGDLPGSVDLVASREEGSQVYNDVTALDLSGFNVKIAKLAEVKGKEYALPEDSDNSSAYDDLTDGVQVVIHDVKKDTQRVLFEVLESESPDLDLFVGLVFDEANPVDEAWELCVSATATALESCDFDAGILDAIRDFLGTDTFQLYALVQNWAASSEGAVDAFSFAATNVGDKEDKDVYAEGPTGFWPALEPFDVRFFWDKKADPGDRYISTTEWYADSARTQLLGSAPMQFTRDVNDVALATDAVEEVMEGDVVTVAALVEPNFTNEDRTYTVEVKVPKELDIDLASINEGGTFVPKSKGKGKGKGKGKDEDEDIATDEGGSIFWTVTQESLLGKEGSYSVSTNFDDPSCSNPFGEYVDFGAIFGADPFSGDSFAVTYFAGNAPMEFYGVEKSTGLTVTDDGFGFFESTPGPTPFFNAPIPTADDPNDMVAPFWHDWTFLDDGASGLTAITAGGDALKLVQWSGVEFWQPDGPGVLPKSGDFQVLIWNEPGPGPEIYFTYNNMFEPLNNDIEAIFGPFVSGVENSTGTAGTAYEGPFPTGLIVCMDYDGPNNDPRPLLFSATVADDKDAKVEVKHSVDNPGSDEEKEKLKIEVSKNKGKGKDKGKKDKS